MELSDMVALVRRTEGVSGAFIRELLRKAAVYSAEDDGAGDSGELIVRDRHVEEAIGELLVSGGILTRSLIGAAPAASA